MHIIMLKMCIMTIKIPSILIEILIVCIYKIKSAMCHLVMQKQMHEVHELVYNMQFISMWKSRLLLRSELGFGFLVMTSYILYIIVFVVLEQYSDLMLFRIVL